MDSLRVKQLVKEELRKVLKEVDWNQAEKEFKRDDIKRDYPRGGEDEEEPTVGTDSYTLRYGLDFPEVGNHRLRSHDFQMDSDFEDDFYEGRANVLGDEWAEKPCTIKLAKDTDKKWAEWFDSNKEMFKSGQKDQADPKFVKWYEKILARKNKVR